MTTRDLILDLFAGGGGASSGIRQATGRHPDVAINHNPEAIGLHQVNHPETLHYCCDIAEVHPAEVLSRFPGRRVGLMWASPDCRSFSKAKGGKPVSKNNRALAWHVIRWAALIKRQTGAPPRVIILENVEEFQDWGPLDDETSMPIKAQKGETFKAWVGGLIALGGRVEYREEVAANFGTPTTRKRLFLIARFDHDPILWPSATHAKAGSAKVLSGELQPWRPAADIIDWSLPTPSIFDRRKDLAVATHRRIAKGIKRFVIDAANPFIVPITHTGEPRIHNVKDPLRTITCAHRGEFSLAVPTLVGTAHGDDRAGAGLRAWSPKEPTRTVKTSGDAGLSTAILTPSITTFYGDKADSDVRGGAMDDPLQTITAARRHGVLSPILVPRYGEAPGQEPRSRSIEEPYPTVVTTSNGGSLATALIVKQNHGDTPFHDTNHPLHTVVAGGNTMSLATANLIRTDMQSAAERNGVHSAEEPLRTMTTNGGFAVASAHITKFRKNSTGADAMEPMPTVTANGPIMSVPATRTMTIANLNIGLNLDMRWEIETRRIDVKRWQT